MDKCISRVIHNLFSYGSQYYVLGRYAAFAGQAPVAGNVLHHAVEMFLKEALSQTMSLDDIRTLGHDLPSIWEAFKAQQKDDNLKGFDSVISSLDQFEDIRYPDKILEEGAVLRMDIRKQGRVDASPTSSMPLSPEYALFLKEIDELVAVIFEKASRNPKAYLNFATYHARKYFADQNVPFKHFFEQR
jgi:hypothetical protein